jgi:ubiquinone/menaquinone biosynthesis C-methylase UbiE
MSFLTAFFYDRVMSAAEQACLAEWRRELLAEARGEVLEVGAGTGASIEFYPDSVSRLVLSEPDPHMRKQLSERVKQSRGRENSSIRTGSAEQIEAEDESFDCVVTSLVCCSVADLDAGLREIRRVLRVGGNFLFMEHVAAQAGSSRRRWQNRINPLWRRVMGNCHLNRETEQAILAAGFEFTRIERESMRKVLPIVRPTIRGIARKI